MARKKNIFLATFTRAVAQQYSITKVISAIKKRLSTQSVGLFSRTINSFQKPAVRQIKK